MLEAASPTAITKVPIQNMKAKILCLLPGALLLLLTIAVVVWNSMQGFEILAPLGQTWFSISAGTLNGLQAGVERYISPELWDSYLAPMLHWPALWFPLVPGLIFTLICVLFWLRKKTGLR